MDFPGVSKDMAVRELAGPGLQKRNTAVGGSSMPLHDATQMGRKILFPGGSAISVENRNG